MTSDERQRLKARVDGLRRQRAERELIVFGTYSCLHCGSSIEAKPRVRFCTPRCQKRHNRSRKELVGRGCNV